MDGIPFTIAQNQPEPPVAAFDPDLEDVRAFVGRMHRPGPVRSAAAALLRGDRPLPTDVYAAAESLRNFWSGRWKERFVAAWVVGRAADSDADREGAARWLAHMLEQCPREEPIRRLGRSYLRTAIALASLFALGGLAREGLMIFLLFPILKVLGGSFIGAFFLAMPLTIATHPFSSSIDRRRLNRVRACAARTMTHLAKPELAGTLANAYFDRNRQVREAAAQSLGPTLRAIDASHLWRLPGETVPRLCRLLGSHDQSLVMDVLRALDLAGDSRAIRSVAWVERRGSTAEIRAEAGMVHQTLVRRREVERASGRLLRPAEGPADPSISLLRPAESTSHPASLLLRPAPDSERLEIPAGREGAEP